jgi:hypothetical protein
MRRLATREPVKIVALLTVFLLLVFAISSCAFRLTDAPSGVACVSPLIELSADSSRARGIVIERRFGCTFYFYETPGLAD